jgi:hypothetical protein
MNNLAENLESIFEAESVHLDQFDSEIVEFSPEHREVTRQYHLVYSDWSACLVRLRGGRCGTFGGVFEF